MAIWLQKYLLLSKYRWEKLKKLCLSNAPITVVGFSPIWVCLEPIYSLFYNRGGGSRWQNVTIFKVVFKIHFLSHFGLKKFWVKIGGGSQYLANFRQFLDFENFYECLTFLRGKKHFFFKKCPNNGLVSEKNTLFFFVTIVGGGSQTGL